MITLNKPYLTGNEIKFIQEDAANQQIAGDGIFTAKCRNWLEEKLSG